MGNHDESIDQALEAFSRELTAARLPAYDSPLDEIGRRIKALRKEPGRADLAEKVRQLRAELISVLQTIAQSAGAEAARQAEDAASLSPEQVAAIKQRFEACLHYVADREDRQGKPPSGDLAWLARLRV